MSNTSSVPCARMHSSLRSIGRSVRRFARQEVCDFLRQLVALLLIYTTVGATMPVRADELRVAPPSTGERLRFSQPGDGQLAKEPNARADRDTSRLREPGHVQYQESETANGDRPRLTANASLRPALRGLFASTTYSVTPILECVVNGGSGNYTAWFGYQNGNSTTVSISVGNNNGFSPTPQNRNQTTSFLAGQHDYAFSVPFNGSNLTWTVTGPDGKTHTVTASSKSGKCVPVANAGSAQSVYVGSTVQLDGTKSYDPAGLQLTYSWSFASKPSGSTATLTNPTSSKPTFVADKAGSYSVQLIVNNGQANSSPSTVCITSQYSTPVANAGPPQTVYVGTTVQLNGTASYDPAGLPLTYSWSFVSIPSGSTAKLSSSTSASPTFVADKVGSYTVKLVVNNGHNCSPPATVTITSQYSTPVANAGPNQTVYVGATVQLNGAGSYDPAGLPLTYSWSFVSVPSGSTAKLSSSTSASPTFVADKVGSYTVKLIVNNGHNCSAPSTVTITSQYSTPIANAGPPQTVYVGTTVQLNGTGSSDPAGLPLTYSWSFVLPLPAGSTATLTGATSSKPSFVADKAGTYKVQLIVNNGHNNSAPSTVVITSQNLPPVANAGPPQTVFVGSTVQLDGTGSYDPAGLPLTYAWSFSSVPSGSSAALSNATSARPTFVVDKPGTYTVQLVVSNGVLTSTPSTVPISTKNSPPVANAGPNQTVKVHTTVQLDGSGSTDVDGDPLTYSWTLTPPAGSNAALSNTKIVNPTFVVDVKGTYVAQLIVNDGYVNSNPSSVTISTQNSPPVANAGSDQSITVDSTVHLDGSASTDVDGDSLTYSWSFTAMPTGSTAALSNPNAVMPTFVADLLGEYDLQLIVNDGTVNSTPSTVRITSGDVAPIANPGPGQSVKLGSIVNLDGSGSTDSDHQPLTYKWSLLSKPANSSATLSLPTSATPYFTADTAGNYVVQLIVNDGFLDSQPANVPISTINTPPVADPGPDQTVTAGDTVQLSGAASSDADGDPLTYKWAILSQPVGGTAVLSNATIVNPTFVANMSGLYVVQLIVNDGKVDSLPKTVKITANPQNQPPVVNAGPNQTITLPVNSVTLAGTATDDGLPNGTLTINWSELNGPSGVTFGTPTQAVTTAVFPGAGTYRLQITARDSQLSSSATTTVTVNSSVAQPPIVNAGPNQTVPYPNVLPLQGSVTSANSPPGTVTALWNQVSGPAMKFPNPASPTTSATLNTAGTYELQLTGTEAGLSSSARVTITTVQGNQPPVVNAGPDQTITLPTTTAGLRGSATDDGLPVGSTLTYLWSVVAGTGVATFANASAPVTTASFSAPGKYTLRLTASDSQLSGSATTQVTVLPQNEPPVVNAGPNQTITLPINVVLLAGTASDDGQPAGSTLKTTWTMVSGPGAVAFGNSSALATSATFIVAGTYDLRLTADDSQYRTSADVFITVNPAVIASAATIVLTPPTASPVSIGSPLQFQAAVQDGTGAPIVGVTVTFNVTGVNPGYYARPTDANGNAILTYIGNVPGVDEVTASEGSGAGTIVSKTSTVNWVNSSPAAIVSSVSGQFFTSDGSGMFDTPSSAQPVFSQTFDSVDFNPPAGTVPGTPSSIDVTTRPFTAVTTDSSGTYTGNVIAQGNGYQAGMGTLSAFQADFTGTITVAGAGNVTFNFYNADGFVFGVGNGASRVSGTFVQPPNSGVTVFYSYPVMGSFNTVTAPVANSITVRFPGAGTYPFELDYAASNQNALIAPGSIWKYTLNNPTGFQQPGFDDSAFVDGYAPFTNAVGAQSPGFGCPLIGATYFPVNGIVDMRKTIYLPSGMSNVTAYVAIDNDFTLWVNGTQITDQTSEGCAYEWNRTIPIPDSVWVQGNNLIAFQARDRGGATGFETQLIEGSGNQGQTKPLTLTMNINQNNGQSAVVLSPAGSISKTIGQAASFTAVVNNTSGALVPNQTVTFNVAGANVQQFQAVTDNTGTASFTYHGFSAGTDVVQAEAPVSGSIVISGQTTISWSSAGNQPPSVNAGPNQTIVWPSNTVVLSGTATDDGLPNGTLTVSWAQLSGPAGAFVSTPNQLSTVVVFSRPGTYVYQLTASDSVLSTSSTVTVNMSQPNQAPVINVSADNTSLTLPANTVNVTGTVTDDGLPIGAAVTEQWSEVSGPGTVSFSNPTSPNTKITFPASGSYVLALTATDTQLSSSVNLAVTVNPAAQNQAPVVTTIANPASITLPNNVVALSGKVTDDGLPVGASVTMQWSQISGPAQATFSSPNTASTQVGFPAAGLYVFQLAASDTQLTGSAQVSVTVNALSSGVNQPPTVAVLADHTSLTLPLNTAVLTGVANDDGLPNGTLNTQWAQVSGPAAANFVQSSPTSLTVAFPAVGVYGIQFTASDGQLSSSATIDITVTNPGGNQPPTVNAGPNQTITLPQTTATLNGYAADDGLPSGTLTVQWSQISGPATAVFSAPNSATTQVALPTPGTYVLELSANDTQLTTTSQVTIVSTSLPGAPPTVTLTAPTDDVEVTAPTAVNGTVSNGNWVLQYAATNEANPQAQPWTTFASGSGAASGTLAQFDPTLLLNGEYTIQLVTTDSFGQSAAASVTVEVGRNMKLGAFSIAFQDLSVPLPGLPITITRTYDSRDRSQGDFGDGWRLSIANVRLQKNGGALGLSWDEEVSWGGLADSYCLQAARNHTVTATFPDGRVYRFAPSTSQTCQSFGPLTATNMTFVQVPTGSNTSGAALAPVDGGAVLVDGAVPGPLNLVDYNGNLYDPTQFLLTTADGFTYTIDQTLGVTQVKDLNGNTLTINSSGVVSSTGKSVAFTRDGQGRITQIADPSGAFLSYSYSASGDLSGVTDRSQNTTTFSYDNNHYLLNIKDPTGTPAIRSTYDASGRLLSSTDANGKTINYTQNIAGQIEQVRDRLGNTTTYAYDADGNILSMTDALGNTSSYTYDAFDNKLTETNPLHQTTAYSYDGFGNRLTEADPLGNTTTYTYNSRNQVLTVSDPQGHTTTNVYDTNGNLTSTTDANGKTTSTVYGANGLPTSVTDANGKTTQFQYDGSGNLTQQIDALNNVTIFTYDSNNNKLSQAVTRTVNGQPQSITTNYKYDASNRVTETDYADGTKTQVQYNSIGKQSVTIDQLGHQTSYTYDTMGRLTTTTYSDNTTDSATFDAENDRLTSTDRAGYTTSYAYDADKRSTKTTYADQSFTQTNYDTAGRVSSTIDANGHTTAYGYDDAGRRTTLTDTLTHVTTFAYDNSGNQLSVKDARQNTTQYQYDTLNRQIAIIYPDQTTSTTAYDALGRVASKTDQAGKVTAYGYDPLGRLTSVTQDAVQGGLNLVTTYDYDEVGNRISQTDANNHTTTYAYDQLGRRIGRTLPAGQSESYVYDSAGNLKSKTDFNGKTTTYAYDNSNRLLSKTPDASFNAPTVSFTYTANGLRQTMADISGTTTYAHDTRNRLTSKQTPFGTLNYTYDNAGDVLTITSSNTNGASLTYTYDTLNRLATVTDNRLLAQGATSGLTTYNYDAVGNLQNFVYPNGVTSAYSYDALNRLTQMGSSKNSTAISNYAYTLGAAGNRTSVAELSGRTVAYAYDSLYRLTTETVSADPNNKNGAGSYTYDNVGNRKTLSSTLPPAGANNYSYDADDRLASDQYDADGNTVNSLGVANSYDFENHLITHGGVTAVYDADGNRVSETVGGVITNYLVDTQNPTGYAQVVDEVQSGTVTRTYAYGLERISENQIISSAWTPSFYGYDGHGSVRQLTNAAGTVTDSYDYDAFGNLTNSTGTTPNNYLFAGEQFDPALGMYFLRARYYNATTGRFWSMDTVEGNSRDPLSLHKYLYAASNPANLKDPTGHDFDLGSMTAAMGDMMTIASQAVTQAMTVLGNFYYTLGPAVPALIEKGSFYLLAGTVALVLASDAASAGATGLSRLANNLNAYSGEDFSTIPCIRGNQIGQCAQQNLGPNFPAFDNFENGEATQLFSTGKVNTPEELVAAVRGKVNQWQSVYDSRNVFSGRGADGSIITFGKEEIRENNMLVVTPRLRFGLGQVATQLEQLEGELDQIVIVESDSFVP